MSLMQSRYFGPFFWTQALGAFNDNVFKQVVLLLITFVAVPRYHWDSGIANNAAAALFMAPFILCSGRGGLLADTWDKSRLIRALKAFEVVSMVLGAIAIWCEAFLMLLGVLCLIGIQAALFGPVKYAILPQHVPRHRLVSANAWIEMGTFLAILLGTMLAGGLMMLPGASGRVVIGITLIVVALAGLWTANRIPPALPEGSPQAHYSRGSFRVAWQHRSMRYTILGISMFWFLGACYLTQLPMWVRDVSNGNEGMVSVLLGAFATGIGLGAFLYSKLSVGRLELGLVPIGALLIAICGIMFAYSGHEGPLVDASLSAHFWDGSLSWMCLELVGIGIGGGLYIMPLYLFIQLRSKASHRARMVAVNNIVNAVFMLFAALFAVIVMDVFGQSLPVLMALVALIALIITAVCVCHDPRPCLRMLIFIGIRLAYKLRVKGRAHIPEEGPAVVVCNHVSYMDALILGGACPRPLRFVMDTPAYESLWLNGFCRLAGAIPINTSRQRGAGAGTRRALEQIKVALEKGEVVMIFPEGRLTRNGEIGSFQRGIERIVEQSAVPVIPAALSGLWGGWGSYKDSPPFTGWPRNFHARVRLVFGAPIPPEQVTRERLYERVKKLKQALDRLG